MSIVIAGATGKLGGLAAGSLIRRGVAPGDIIAAGRNTDRLAEHAAKGLRTARIDMDDRASLDRAFAGATSLLLVSVNGNPRRVEQHRDAIESAAAAGIGLIVYTSFLRCDSNSMHPDHCATELILRDCGVPHVILRNGSYFDFCTRRIPFFREHGRITGAAGDGLMGAVARADLADVAAAVVLSPGTTDVTYELAGDQPFTMTEFAAELSRQTGQDIPYVNMTIDDYIADLVGAGMGEAHAKGLANVDREIALGEMSSASGDLVRLLGRPLVTLADRIAEALA
jgi:NAD(P)H dehydrogenase (quinone)